ncbi:hypothetical protein DOY81_000362 [Sarcophaga bullata]|nr:hypothetical protein DOY81_000362 [Sarcophaga bullata]
MKSLTAKVFCCSCKLYKIGFLVGFIYLIPNLIVLACIFLNGYYDYTLALLCVVTLLSSLLLLKGLMEERHVFLLPWLVNIALLIAFNLISLTVQFGEMQTNNPETNLIEAFDLEFGFLIGLGIQILCWYIIFCLFQYGYGKKNTVKETVNIISKVLESKGQNHQYTTNIIRKEPLLVTEMKVLKVEN